MSTALSGATLGVVNALPATYNEAGYEALTFVTGTCALKTVPSLDPVYTGIDNSTVCNRLKTEVKGTRTITDPTYQLNIIRGDAAQVIYEALRDSDDVGSFALTFPSGEIAYWTAQVSQFAFTDGGDGDTLNMGTVTLKVQSDIVLVDAA